ncbi:ATP-dependent DNA helicase PIF1 [Purpureocillium lavendulum]|uniref:ATP-dependent DNA helicase PIF1 n=1 Tax=Purpureocillium lavendulum TaxID=1247861 RepID=A0AB34FFY4_9HYPO|nr:ATP-dependent DNA helicase PIF1 [Purpureocillium lavendulum]
MSVRIQRQRKRSWQQNDVSRKGLPCTAAFACTDYKVQGMSLDRVALELRGTRTTNVGGRAVPAQCDPYSLYVQLSRCRTLDGIMLVSRVRERDLVGNQVPDEMRSAQARLQELSDKTLGEALEWLGDECTQTWSPPPQSLQQPHRPHHQQNLGAQPAGLAQYPAAYDQPLQPYNRVYQPVPYSQQQNQPNPEQLYQWQERQRVPEPKGWKWTKVSLHILSFMLSIIGFGLALSLIRYNAISLPPLACGPVLGVATLWSAAELITLACRKFMAGIHPGAHVGISLVLWLGGGGCGGWTMSEAPAYVSRSTAAAVLTLIVAFIHLVLFIGACVDTAKRNSLAKRPILVANWPPYTAQALQPTTPQQSPHQQQKQQQPQQQQRTQIEQDKDGPVEIRTASPNSKGRWVS